eukprot:TRINITY_DN1475_c0_g1_i2.p1 TRINITY_DN1475_c0_g1~~TRINITY_DN1475_c0_g1_i2.p1  ORF type:complete len:583 (+),score=48.01 TRINITY_DN1475_c0_g1_i2:67-1815(+)
MEETWYDRYETAPNAAPTGQGIKSYGTRLPPERVRLDRATLLGRGASGTVYAGVLDGATSVAIKVGPRLTELNQKKLEQINEALYREMRILHEQSHRNLVRYYGSYVDNQGRFHIVMERCETNAQMLAKAHSDDWSRYKLSMLQRLFLGRDLASALQCFHQREDPIILKDLKLGNVLVSKTGNTYVAKLADFGVSDILLTTGEHDRSPGPGNVWTMAPEVLEEKSYDTSADVYSFGLCLLELVTGEDPFLDYKIDLQRTGHHSRDDCPPLCHSDFKDQVLKNPHLLTPMLEDKHIIDSLRGLLERCMQHEPIKRPQCDEIIMLLNDIMIEYMIGIDVQFWNFPYDVPSLTPKWDDWIARFQTFFSHALSLKEQDTLKSLICEQANDGWRVQPEQLMRTLNWFGPLACDKCSRRIQPVHDDEESENRTSNLPGPCEASQPEFSTIDDHSCFIDTMMAIMNTDCFHPTFLSETTSGEHLRGIGPGGYLVRFSQTIPGCFVISRFGECPLVVQRNRNAVGPKWQLLQNQECVVVNFGNKALSTSYPSLYHLIDGIRDSLQLYKPLGRTLPATSRWRDLIATKDNH